MSLYVLDTDILSLLQDGNPNVVRRIADHDPTEIAITVITVDEQLSGWYASLRRARKPEEMARVYSLLIRNVQSLAPLAILNFTEPAIARFEALKRMKLNVGSPDLRIAAIVLESNATLVPRNSRDFGRVPGLTHENWVD